MRLSKSRLGLAALAVTLAVGAGAGTLPAMAQTAMTSEVPLSRWDTPSPMQFDGMSTWLATFNDPTAGAGQADPSYEYAHEFEFADSSSFGLLSLTVDNGGIKLASLLIVDVEELRMHSVQVAFPWSANSFYFLWTQRLAPGVWGAWAYDNTAATWTFIGSVLVPTRLAKLKSNSGTGVAWTGPALATCDAFPKAVMTRMAPVGYIGSTPVQTHLSERRNNAGDCPATAAPFVGDWDYYVVGSDAPPAPAAAAVATKTAPTHVPGSERRYFATP